MQGLGLIKKENDILSITTTGEILAAKFEERFSVGTKVKFFNIVKRGSFTCKEIMEFKDEFYVTNIQAGEQEFYHKILLAYDHGFSERDLYSEHRKITNVYFEEYRKR